MRRLMVSSVMLAAGGAAEERPAGGKSCRAGLVERLQGAAAAPTLIEHNFRACHPTRGTALGAWQQRHAALFGHVLVRVMTATEMPQSTDRTSTGVRPDPGVADCGKECKECGGAQKPQPSRASNCLPGWLVVSAPSHPSHHRCFHSGVWFKAAVGLTERRDSYNPSSGAAGALLVAERPDGGARRGAVEGDRCVSGAAIIPGPSCA